jgi:serine/threonine-protein kinase
MPELCKNEEPVMRFLREARAAVRIRNEHVARLLDVGKLDTGAPTPSKADARFFEAV